MSSRRVATAPDTLRSLRLWREGRHWQIEIGSTSLWFGIATDRWMIGVVLNPQALNLGFGVGPFYFGIGAAYDR